jgi:hypothetical protein
MERLTDKCWRNFDPWECCGQDSYCKRGCHKKGGCMNGCIVPKLYARLAKYEDLEDRLDEKFLGCLTLKKIVDTFIEFYNQQEKDEELAKCMLITNDNVKKYRQWKEAEEQGLLLRLPCKVGDTVYELRKCNDNNGVYRIFLFSMVVKDISPYGTLRQYKSGDCVWNIYAESDYTYMYKSFYDFGKTVFLTKSEAEQTLKELNK